MMPSLPWDNIPAVTEEPTPTGAIKDIPDGAELTVIITEIADKTFDSGAINVDWTYEVVDGEFTKNRVWHSMNVVKKDGTPNSVAQQQFAWICQKLNLDPEVAKTNTDMLLNKPLQIKVKEEAYIKRDGTAGRKVVPVQWRSLGQSFDTRNTSTPQPAAAAQAAPWGKV